MIAQSFFGYKTEIDETATKQWYEGFGGWSCECGHCRNFMRHAASGTLPQQLTDMLGKLKIPADKATYVCQLYEENGLHRYQISYRIAGKILSAPNAPSAADIGRCCHEIYPYGAPNFPEPHFDLEFYVSLPWAI